MGHKAHQSATMDPSSTLWYEKKCANGKGIKTVVLLCIDWKMKGEPFTDRETMIEHYG